MSGHNITLGVVVFDGDAVAVAVELFEAYWNSHAALALEELLVDGKPVYKETRDAYFQKVKASLSVDSALRCEQVERGEE